MSLFDFVSRNNKKVGQKQNEREEAENRKQEYRDNLFILRENLHYKNAYYKNGVVYCQQEIKDFIIGYYDENGTVYSNNHQEIGRVSSELIQMNRLGELDDVRNKLGDEAYFSLCKATNICWNCAEISLYDSTFGCIREFLGLEEPIGAPVQSLMKEKNAVGYGACFLCLEYFNGASSGGKYASFYCALGEKFVNPY